MIPPARSHINAALGSAFIICVNDKTQAQPITIYNADDIHLGQVTQHSLNMMPITAIPHTRARSAYPVVL